VNCNKFPEICLKEFRYVSQQKANIFNIFYDGEHNINYYIWLIINERSKGCELAVPAARQHFSRQVTKGFRRKLPSVQSTSSEPALCTHNRWTLKSFISRALWIVDIFRFSVGSTALRACADTVLRFFVFTFYSCITFIFPTALFINPYPRQYRLSVFFTWLSSRDVSHIDIKQAETK
jgi:hypothetical protein